MAEMIASPPVALTLFLGLVAALYGLSRRWAPRGEDSPGKREPYACGGEINTEGVRLSYKRFFRLALMFVLVHVAILVLALLPRALDARILGTLYLGGVVICIDILVRPDEE